MALPDRFTDPVSTRRRVRVLRIITRLNVGGPALHVSLLTARLDPERFETLLVSGREDAAEGNMLELGRIAASLPLVRLPTMVRAIRPLGDLRTLWSLVRIIRRFRPDVVHTHLAKAGLLGRLAARLAGVPVVVHTYHGSVLRGYFGPRQSRLLLWIDRWLARLSSRLIAITPSGRRELSDLGVAPADRIEVIPLGLDLESFRERRDSAAARRSLGIAPETPVIGIVGRLVPIKDVGTFLRAVELASRTVPDLVALIVGDGEERAALEALATPRCRFLGFREDVQALLGAMDVLALSSRNEGSPVSLIEGLAAGKPVVATAVGGVPDVVRDGETGLLVPPGDPEALAAAMVRLLTDRSLAARLGAAGAAAVFPAYDISRLVPDIEALYLRLGAGSR